MVKNLPSYIRPATLARYLGRCGEVQSVEVFNSEALDYGPLSMASTDISTDIEVDAELEEGEGKGEEGGETEGGAGAGGHGQTIDFGDSALEPALEWEASSADR